MQYVVGFDDITNIDWSSTGIVNHFVSVADIMLNGGSMVMTWTPSRYEGIFHESIKFSAYGMEITNDSDKTAVKKRIINESEDTAWVQDGNGNISKVIWKIEDSGIMINNAKVYGSLSLGYAMVYDPTLGKKVVDNTNVGDWTQLYKMKRSEDNTGVDEYIYSNNNN